MGPVQHRPVLVREGAPYEKNKAIVWQVNNQSISMVWVRERTIPTERPQLVGEVWQIKGNGKIWSWAPKGCPTSRRTGRLTVVAKSTRTWTWRVNALIRPRSNFTSKLQTHPLVGESAPHQERERERKKVGWGSVRHYHKVGWVRNGNYWSEGSQT
jgi:hypothetical protein